MRRPGSILRSRARSGSRILPKLALNAQNVIIDTKDAKVSAARLRAEVSVATLFGAMPHLVALELDGGVVKLSEAAAEDPVGALIGVLSKDHALQIDAVTLNTIAITRADGDTPLATIERGEATLPAYQGPLRLSAEGVLGAISGRGRLAIGPPEADLDRHVSIAFDADGDADARGWRLTFEGQATQNGQTPVTLDGAVALAQSDRVGLRTGSGGTGDAPSWRAQAKAHGELRALRFDGIEISREQAAALRLTGQGALDLTADPKLTLDLAARRSRARSARRGEPPGSEDRRREREPSARRGSESARRRRDGVAAALAQRRPQPRRRDGGARRRELRKSASERDRIRGRGRDLVLERQLGRARRHRLLGERGGRRQGAGSRPYRGQGTRCGGLSPRSRPCERSRQHPCPADACRRAQARPDSRAYRRPRPVACRLADHRQVDRDGRARRPIGSRRGGAGEPRSRPRQLAARRGDAYLAGLGRRPSANACRAVAGRKGGGRRRASRHVLVTGRGPHPDRQAGSSRASRGCRFPAPARSAEPDRASTHILRRPRRHRSRRFPASSCRRAPSKP